MVVSQDATEDGDGRSSGSGDSSGSGSGGGGGGDGGGGGGGGGSGDGIGGEHSREDRPRPVTLPTVYLDRGEPAPSAAPPPFIELSLSFDFEETHQSVVSDALKRAEKLPPIRAIIAII
ncbi:hypothetical protein HZH68_005834 [Vespula germanica]|uniref:Uncharacterized protein n=1 Tax=Vespula germanica TaxID=30212 RepID=A0A834KGZ3_VESGE|nr:hypothetical protein HZH68_005834 [Vespula germanica]